MSRWDYETKGKQEQNGETEFAFAFWNNEKTFALQKRI